MVFSSFFEKIVIMTQKGAENRNPYRTTETQLFCTGYHIDLEDVKATSFIRSNRRPRLLRYADKHQPSLAVIDCDFFVFDLFQQRDQPKFIE